MKKTFLLLFCIFSYYSWAQIEVISIAPSHQNTKHFRLQESPIDTLSLPFFDDFSTTNTGKLDTKKWLSSGVYVNNTFCQNPPNFQVASFDGTNQYGQPYSFLPNTDDINLIINDFTDNLTSKPIDLSTITASSELVFSFFWQKGGLTKHHEPTIGDSLYVYFLDLDSNWVKVWPTNEAQFTAVRNAKVGTFYSEFITITEDKFLHKGFQFKFATFGRATGPWDLWSIDYVLLDAHRSNDLIVDFGYSTTPTPLLKEYSMMPYAHFKKNAANYLNTKISTTVRSLSTEPNIVKDSTIIIKDLISKKTLDSTDIDDTKIIKSLENYTVSWNFSPEKIAQNIPQDQQYAFLETTFNLSSTKNDTILSNNKIRNTTLLANHYAYDDGSAEGGIGIREYGLVALKYDLKEADSLSAIDIFFPKIEVNMANTNLNLRVWKSLKGIDGATETEILYNLSTQLYYSDSTINKFTTYNIGGKDAPLILPKGKFYIGYEQPNSLYRLYVGLDENTNTLDNFYYLSEGNWNQNFLEEGVTGSVMMRPKFGFLADPTVGTQEKITQKNEYIVYPNPSTGIFQIDGEFTEVLIFDLMGNMVLQSQEHTIDLSNMNKGMYILHILNNNTQSVKKIIIE